MYLIFNKELLLITYYKKYIKADYFSLDLYHNIQYILHYKMQKKHIFIILPDHLRTENHLQIE